MKHFRIKSEDVTRFYCDGVKRIRYTIEQRFTVLFFIHFWSSPIFAPPHNSLNKEELINNIKEHYSKFNIIEYGS